MRACQTSWLASCGLGDTKREKGCEEQLTEIVGCGFNDLGRQNYECVEGELQPGECVFSDPCLDGLEQKNSPEDANASCKEILDSGASQGNGMYWINPNGD